MKKNSKKLEVERVIKRKIFKDLVWNDHELYELKSLLSLFKKLTSNNLQTIFGFKVNKLKNWRQRYIRLSKNITAKTKYNYLLRYGKVKGIEKWAEYIKNLSYKSSKEYLIVKFGEEKANKIIFDKGKNFRNPETQRENSLKFKKKKENNPDKYKGILPNQLDYWINKGYTKEQSEQKLSERQSTFSYNKCIEKYGLIRGYIRFKKRQEQWQNTLNSKPQEEIDRINKDKKYYLKRENESKDAFLKRVQKLGTNIIFDEYDLKKYIINELKKVKWKYLTKDEFIKNLPFTENSEVTPSEILDSINFPFPNKNKINKEGKFYTLKVSNGYLRSSYEIDFYYELLKRNINFEIEKFYNINDKKQKCDFYLSKEKLFIEIAGTIGNADYDRKMKLKEKEYDALILRPHQINKFFKRIDNAGFNGIKNYIRGVV